MVFIAVHEAHPVDIANVRVPFLIHFWKQVPNSLYLYNLLLFYEESL